LAEVFSGVAVGGAPSSLGSREWNRNRKLR
jgi:hypothetical protein